MMVWTGLVVLVAIAAILLVMTVFVARYVRVRRVPAYRDPFDIDAVRRSS